MVDTGVPDSAEDQRQNKAMSDLVQTVLQGADPYIDETVDPSFAVGFLQQAIMVQESTGGKESTTEILGQILAVYLEFQKEMEQIFLDAEATMQQNVTERWKADLEHGNWLTRSVRPLVLVFLISIN